MGLPGKIAVSLALILVVLGGAYWSLDRPGGNERAEKNDAEVEQVLEQFQLIENMGEDGQWVLNSPRAERAAGEVRLESPRVIYREQGDTKALITARGGRYNLAERKIELNQEVVLNYFSEDQVLYTDYLRWDVASGIVTSDHRVRLELREGILTGKGLWADLEEEKLQLESEVEFRGR